MTYTYDAVFDVNTFIMATAHSFTIEGYVCYMSVLLIGKSTKKDCSILVFF